MELGSDCRISSPPIRLPMDGEKPRQCSHRSSRGFSTGALGVQIATALGSSASYAGNPLIRHMIKGWRDTRDLCLEQLQLIQFGKGAILGKRRRHDERGHGLAAKGQSGNGRPN